ncbi:MAG TPA: hypothetical protein VEB40_09845 [Flavipsychrobacter sp.]|nr:hypothetical protein [Flavipsychrobacter sp.]
MKHLLGISFIFLFLASCGNRSPLTKAEQRQVAAEVEQMIQRYSEDIKENGLLAEFRYLDSSADFYWIPPGYNDSIAYDSVAAILKRNAPRFRSINNVYDSLEILPISNTSAMYTATVHSTKTDTSGKTTSHMLFENAMVVKRTDGWKLLAGKTTVKK